MSQWWRFWRGESEAVTGHPEVGPAWDLHVDSDGWLVGTHVERIPSVRHSRLTTPGERPWGVMLHYTATAHGTAKSLAKRIRAYDRTKDRAASWHVCIAHDGTLWQSVSLERGAWHCAKGRLGIHTINKSTIGVELEGYGKSPLPAMQVAALGRLYHAVIPHYGILADNAALEHRHYDPSRRSDPGDEWAATAEELLKEYR